MNRDRFEQWWARNPAFRSLGPAAKELALGIWSEAREDTLEEVRETAMKTPKSILDVAADMLWVDTVWKADQARDAALGRVPLRNIYRDMPDRKN